MGLRVISLPVSGVGHKEILVTHLRRRTVSSTSKWFGDRSWSYPFIAYISINPAISPITYMNKVADTRRKAGPEGHNLSDQQTDLLTALEPNVIPGANATCCARPLAWLAATVCT
jgi:hypothetical protein